MAKKSKGKEPPPPPPDPKDKKSKKKGNIDVPPPSNEPAKPQRGLAIGENFGWTGKLPATLLFEYAQKQKWEKVVIDMRKNSKGFTGVVNLKWKNPKTQELISVQMIPHSDTYQPRETTNEARHFAATYALYRINFVKNMKMVLPKLFRDYWSDLEVARSEMLKKDKVFHDILYNAQPFQVFIEQREITEKREKDKLIKVQQDEKVKKATVSIATTASTGTKKNNNNNQTTGKISKLAPVKLNKIMKKIPSFPNKAWENAPFIDFTSDMRTKIEDSIKKHINWTIQTSANGDKNSHEDWFNALTSFGFRELHIRESFKYTSTFTDSLEWLLFHIPEDDLPAFFMKSDKDSGVSLKISKDIQMEYMIKRISESAVDKDEILTSLQENENNELETIIQLTHKLIDFNYKSDDQVEEESESDSLELWKQEIEGIQLMNESNTVEFVPGSDDKIATIQLNPTKIEKGLLSVRLFKSKSYPQNLPGIQLIVNNSSFRLANYIKLSIIRQLLHYIIDSGFIGSCFVFSIVEWLEENIANIIDNPGPLFDESILIKSSSDLNTNSGITSSSSKGKSIKKVKQLSAVQIEDLSKEYQIKQKSSAMLSSISKRKTLPAWKKAQDLVSIINSNRVTIVTGETGSGKSTQIVQFILDDLNSRGKFQSKIMCTQPRRISTIGLAERISEERCDQLGKETGYLIRGENKTNSNTRLSFVTTGVLLRMIQSVLANKGGNANLFDDLEYIFIDEVHERSVDSDFLLIILRSLMSKFPNLKIVLMSATINVDTFKNFFKTPLNHIHIEGRTFPIKDYYLEEILDDLDYSFQNYDGEIIKPKADSQYFQSGNINYELIAKLCDKVDSKLGFENDGSILIFLPGIMEINKCIRTIEEVNKSKDFWCLPLHSALTSNEQKKVFNRPPKGSRKIVVSTNVAETSITIPDCVVVIDSGRSKTMFFDSKINSTKLIENWCSKAEIGQRRGRSGRITSGNCYHLYTKETVQSMLDQPIPEIKRTRLENLYLVVKSMGIDKVEAFLNSGLDPPDQTSLAKSKQFLLDIGALEEMDDAMTNISHLGKYLSLLPTDLQSGKLLILGCIFGCLDTCLTIAAISITGSPFKGSFEEREKVKQIQNGFSMNQGDMIAMVRAYNEYMKLKKNGGSAKKFLNENYLSFLTMKEITTTRGQYINILQDIGFVPLHYKGLEDSKLNKNNEKYFIVRSIMTGSFYPQLARVQLPDPKFFQTAAGAVSVDPDAKSTKFWIRNEEFINKLNNGDREDNPSCAEVFPCSRAFIHPSSVLFSIPELELLQSIATEEFTNEDGSIDFAKAQLAYKIDFTPSVSSTSANSMVKAPFMIYNSSHHTSKLFLRDVTPTSTLAVLLFGGPIGYDLASGSKGKTSPGIVLDCVWPIRTWCKNGVLIKRLRHLLDGVIEQRLSSPNYSGKNDSRGSEDSSVDDILTVVERILYL